MNEEKYLKYVSIFKRLMTDLIEQDEFLYSHEMLVCLVNHIGQLIDNAESLHGKVHLIELLNISMAEMRKTYIVPVFKPEDVNE